MKKYNIVYADPPWHFNNKNTGGGLKSGAANKYSVMSVDEICNLPIKNIAADNSVLFMWWVASQSGEAIKVANSWGFTIKTMVGFNWVKMTKNNKQFFGMGFWTRAGSECCLLGVRGKLRRVKANVRAVGMFKNEKHSKKPDEFRERIVELMGNLPRIELFARTKTEGWDVFGNEVEGSINL